MINKYSVLNGAKYFSSNGLENYFVVLLNNLHTEYISNNINKIELLSSIGMSQESIKNLHTSDTTFSPEMTDRFTRFGRVKFKSICLKQDNLSFLHRENT